MRTATIPLSETLTLRDLVTQIDRETQSEGSLAAMVLGFAICAGANPDKPIDRDEADMTIATISYEIGCDSPMSVDL